MTPNPALAQPNSQTVLGSLVAHGAPLLGWPTAPTPLPLEETVVRSLAVARLNATVLRVLPGLMARRAADFDLGLLKSWASRLGQEAAVGFLLDLTAHLFGTSPLAQLRDELVHAQHPKQAEFFLASDGDTARGRQLAEARTPECARVWGFRMNMPEQAFKLA